MLAVCSAFSINAKEPSAYGEISITTQRDPWDAGFAVAMLVNSALMWMGTGTASNCVGHLSDIRGNLTDVDCEQSESPDVCQNSLKSLKDHTDEKYERSWYAAAAFYAFGGIASVAATAMMAHRYALPYEEGDGCMPKRFIPVAVAVGTTALGWIIALDAYFESNRPTSKDDNLAINHTNIEQSVDDYEKQGRYSAAAGSAIGVPVIVGGTAAAVASGG